MDIFSDLIGSILVVDALIAFLGVGILASMEQPEPPID